MKGGYMNKEENLDILNDCSCCNNDDCLCRVIDCFL